MNPEGDRLFAVYFDGTAILWDTQTGDSVKVYQYPSIQPIHTEFRETSDQVFIGFRDGTCILQDLATSSFQSWRVASKDIRAMDIHSSRLWLLTALGDSIHCWEGPQLLNTYLSAPRGNITHIQFSSNGDLIFARSDEDFVYRWRVIARNKLTVLIA